MKAQKQEVRTISVRLILLASLLVLPGLAFSTEQAQQRRQGRDVKQDTRQGSRDTKADCRAANQQSNAGCRGDKRDTKQGGRQQARDIKY